MRSVASACKRFSLQLVTALVSWHYVTEYLECGRCEVGAWVCCRLDFVCAWFDAAVWASGMSCRVCSPAPCVMYMCWVKQCDAGSGHAPPPTRLMASVSHTSMGSKDYTCPYTMLYALFLCIVLHGNCPCRPCRQ
jgi:hypothetical protein